MEIDEKDKIKKIKKEIIDEEEENEDDNDNDNEEDEN